jgi:hypothetical protein
MSSLMIRPLAFQHSPVIFPHQAPHPLGKCRAECCREISLHGQWDARPSGHEA